MIKDKMSYDLLTYIYCLTFDSRNAEAKNRIELKEEGVCLVKNSLSFFHSSCSKVHLFSKNLMRFNTFWSLIRSELTIL